jgi:hypothetical protein
MRTTLEFTLPDEAEELHLAQNGSSYHAVLCDVREALRSKLKYDLKLPARARLELDAVYKLLLEGLAGI